MRPQQLYFLEIADDLCPENVRQLIDPAMPLIRGIVADVFSNLLERRIVDGTFTRMNEGESAWWLWTQIQHEAEEQFADGSDIAFRRTRQQSYLVVGDQIVIVYKKLRRVSKPEGKVLQRSNYRTRRNFDYWDQRKLEGFPDLPRVVFGYELIEELTAVRYYLGLPRPGHGELRWLHEITADENPIWGSVVGDSELDDAELPFELVPDEDSMPKTAE